jgi:hypothetical protein
MFFDYDNDGDADLYCVQSGELPGRPGYGKRNRSALYRNEGGGRFRDVTAAAGVANDRYGQGCCAGDIDGDGDLDLYVTNFGANRLYRNNGDGTFTDIAAAAGAAVADYNTSAAFSDLDGDGDLDLYVARYARYEIGADPHCSQAPGLRSYCPPAQFDGAPDVLLRNDGDGSFTDVTRAAGLWEPTGRGLGVLFLDYDDDGRPDLYVANDGNLNRLYRNLGGLRFEDVTHTAGVGMSENGVLAAGMGVDSADYDGDGRPDLLVANFTGEFNDLYRNNGDGTFATLSGPSGLGRPSLPYTGFGTAFLDFDLDGLPDLVVANGHVADDIAVANPGITYGQPETLFRNRGDGRFNDVSRAVGPDVQRLTVSRGLAVADFDLDGDPDFAVSNSNGPLQLFRNDGGNRHRWLRLRLRGAGEPFAVGARVRVAAGGRTQVREVRTGASYCSQSELALTFGLGEAPRADWVEVRWPGGAVQRWEGLAAGQTHLLRQGRSDSVLGVRFTMLAALQLPRGASRRQRGQSTDGYDAPQPVSPATGEGGAEAALEGGGLAAALPPSALISGSLLPPRAPGRLFGGWGGTPGFPPPP